MVTTRKRIMIIGQPGSGKSTLLNHLVGEKIAAVSNKPQTTRHKIRGIITLDEGQIVFQATCDIQNETSAEAVAKAVLNLEHQYYPRIIQQCLDAI